MKVITESEIKRIVKKNMKFAVFLVAVPIIFIQLIAYFSGAAQLNDLLFYIAPISAVGSCGYLIERVLIDINAKSAGNT